MQRFKLIGLLLYVVIVHTQSFSVDKFVYYDHNIKCCPAGDILTSVSENNSYKCVHDSNPITTFEPQETLPNDLLGKSECIDVLKDKNEDIRKVVKTNGSTLNSTYLNLNHFPKCCPLHFVYDLQKHRCVSGNYTNDITSQVETLKNSINKTILYIKYGLGDCNIVISDHELPAINFNDELGLYVEQLNMTVEYGKYCIDNVYDSESHVVRVCHKDFEICKKRKRDSTGKLLCIRKCCPDGKSYRLDHRCSYDYQHGFYVGNETIPEDKYAIIPGLDCRKYLASKMDHILNDVGAVQIMPEDRPSLFMSAFKHTYCYEYADTAFDKDFHLFLCFIPVPLRY